MFGIVPHTRCHTCHLARGGGCLDPTSHRVEDRRLLIAFHCICVPLVLFYFVILCGRYFCTAKVRLSLSLHGGAIRSNLSCVAFARDSVSTVSVRVLSPCCVHAPGFILYIFGYIVYKFNRIHLLHGGGTDAVDGDTTTRGLQPLRRGQRGYAKVHHAPHAPRVPSII